MDEQLHDKESLIARVLQLEHERDELRKDIEQLCMQQAGTSYLAVATRMHFQRTASLEQEIENLRKKLAACTRENSNLHEELSEAYHIKGQFADLHAAEVSKNMEAEKQLKFFQGCVAAAFAERDHSVMEAEKAKENEEFMSQKLNNFKRRVEELTSDFLKEKELTAELQIDLEEQKKQNDTFKKVTDKFYEIRQYSLKGFCEERSWEDKCDFLLNDSAEMWSFSNHGETSTSKYINALEEEVETLRKSVDSLQNKLSVGLEIENHLKKKVRDLEKKNTVSEKKIKKGISGLLHYHSQHKAEVMGLLDEGYSHIKSIIHAVEEKMRQLDASKQSNWDSPHKDVTVEENGCRDVHLNNAAGPNLTNKWSSPDLSNSMTADLIDASQALAQALKEKVAALLLLSQQEERHLLERGVNAALQKKLEELQRNLLQVTNEKVKALMELAHAKQEYQLLKENINDSSLRQRTLLAEIGGKKIVPEKDGRLKNLLKKSYLRRWIGTLDSPGDEAETHMNYGGMKIENATLKESVESMEHLTSAVRRLRLSLLKVKESVPSQDTISGMSESLDDVLNEAKLLKMAIGSSLPVSWSAEAGDQSTDQTFDHEANDFSTNSSTEKVDFVCAAGFEMVESLIFAVQILKEHTSKREAPEMEVAT
ncbi:putative WEB family protein At1g65010, chloroplastic isoform X2 [Diospyros lotus]|uniref:putative WEB family protein At1g65010, chloroplastic isoform X2 n=1 Tax=Diospyros lotus TaxID=55363 RepID=UPI00224D6C96|nr:putative WEB family protein At1g65010, chloroplastic isoform X2 [Diospyros lotus]